MSSTTRKPREGAPLSAAEVEVMGYVVRGFRMPEIAGFMGASRYTTESHMRNLFQKLAASTQAEAAYIVAKRGLLEVQGPPKPTRAYMRSCTATRRQLSRGEKLNQREEEVLAHIRAGKSDRQIAAAMGATQGAVRNQVSNVLAKLGATNRHDAALGIVSPPRRQKQRTQTAAPNSVFAWGQA